MGNSIGRAEAKRLLRKAGLKPYADSVGSDMMAARIRLRDDRDLTECVRLLETVHRGDGYPTYWPDDPARWLSPGAMLGAWVAEDDDRIVGHITLRAGTADASAAVWSDATGLPPEQLASLTRLFVSRVRRGAGVGGALLDAACAEAATRGLHPALDVVETNHDAIRLYEQRGWRRVLSEPWAADHDGKTLLHYYVAPGVESSPQSPWRSRTRAGKEIAVQGRRPSGL